MNRWRIRKRDGKWQLIDPDGRAIWSNAESIGEAHDDATRFAIVDELWKPAGLMCYFGMRRLAERTATDGWLLQDVRPPTTWIAYREGYTPTEHFA